MNFNRQLGSFDGAIGCDRSELNGRKSPVLKHNCQSDITVIRVIWRVGNTGVIFIRRRHHLYWSLKHISLGIVKPNEACGLCNGDISPANNTGGIFLEVVKHYLVAKPWLRPRSPFVIVQMQWDCMHNNGKGKSKVWLKCSINRASGNGNVWCPPTFLPGISINPVKPHVRPWLSVYLWVCVDGGWGGGVTP